MFCFDRKVCYNILRIGVFLRKKALKTLIRQERKQVVDSGIQRKRKKRSICRKEKTAYASAHLPSDIQMILFSVL